MTRNRAEIHAAVDRAIDDVRRAIVTAAAIGLVIGATIGGFLVWLTMK